MSGNASAAEALEPPHIVFIQGPDEVVKGTEIEIKWKLAGGAPTEVMLDGKKVDGTSAKVKVVADPTAFTLTAKNDAGVATAQKWVGAHAEGQCVSAMAELHVQQTFQVGHPYRVDSLNPSELNRVRQNLMKLNSGLVKVTGMPSGHDPSGLDRRLKKLREGHSPADALKLANAEFDRERGAVIWPHMTYLAHGGDVVENNLYRVSHADPHEVARVRKNLAALSGHLSKIPGFGPGNAAELDKKLQALQKAPHSPDLARKINAEFDKERANLFQVRVKAAADKKEGKDAKPPPHPYRATKVDPAEIERVQKNLAALSSGLTKITGLSNNHNPKHLETRLSVHDPLTPRPAHTLDLINHEFDRERTSIIARHVTVLHHGSGPGARGVEVGHPFRMSSPDLAELNRVKRNIMALGTTVGSIPGFGGRFSAAEHDKRLKSLKRGATPAETLARYNAEFDWERANILGVNAKPPPRPPILPAEPAANLDNHAYRADYLDRYEINRVKRNLAKLSTGLSRVSGMRSMHDPAGLEKRLKSIRPGHAPEDQLKLVNAEFDRERAQVIWPHVGHFAHGGKPLVNHAYRVSSADPKEIERVHKNIKKLADGLAKIPGFGPGSGQLDKKIEELKKAPKTHETVKKLNAELDKERGILFQVRQKKDAKPAAPPYRVTKADPAELDRVKKNLAALSAGLSKITGLAGNHNPQTLALTLKSVEKKSSHDHTVDMLNHELDRERTKIIARHGTVLHHGSGPGAKPVDNGHAYRASSTSPVEIARVKKNLAALHHGLSQVPGFGGRFNSAEHDKRLRSIRGITPKDHLDRLNAEFDHVRRNILQVHVEPRPPPALHPPPVNHPYRVDSLHPPEIARVKKNLAALSHNLSKVTGIRSMHHPVHLESRLKSIRPGHAAVDQLKLVNAEFDRERAQVVWPHLGHFAHGGTVQNHAYRVSSADPKEVERVKKNMKQLADGLAKIPGFGPGSGAEHDKRVDEIHKKGPKTHETVKKLNAEFDKERGILLQVRAKKPADPKAPPPYRITKADPKEAERVRKNLAALSAGLSKITGLPDHHNPKKLEQIVNRVPKKGSHDHTVDMVNHELDRERISIVVRHAAQIHHGTGEGHKHVEKGHPYRAMSAHPAEIARVRKNIAKLHEHLGKIPGFGNRHNAAEHDRRLKSIKGKTPVETLKALNAEFDWERRNLLQVHVSPPPRPGAKVAAKPAAGHPAGAKPAAAGHPAGAKPAAGHPAGAKPAAPGHPPAAAKPAAGHPAGAKPAAPGHPPAAAKPAAGHPAGAKPAAPGHPPAAAKPAAGHPAGAKPAAPGHPPAAAKPAAGHPAGAKPAAAKPAAAKPAAAKPAAKPAAPKPGGKH